MNQRHTLSTPAVVLMTLVAADAGSGLLAVARFQEPASEPTVIEAAVAFSTRDMRSIGFGPITARISTNGKRVTKVSPPADDGGFKDVIERTVSSWRFEPHAPTTFSTTFTFRVHNRTCDPNTELLARLPLSIEVRSPSIVCDADRAIRQVSASRLAGRVLCDCLEVEPVAGATVTIRRNGELGPVLWKVRTDHDGRFAIPRADEGRYFVAVEAAHYFGGNWLLNVVSSEREELFQAPLEETPPEVVKAMFPVYPEIARRAGIAGDVVVHVRGKSVRTEGPDALAQAASANFETWRFAASLPKRGIDIQYHYALSSDCGADRSPLIKLEFPTRVEVTACR